MIDAVNANARTIDGRTRVSDDVSGATAGMAGSASRGASARSTSGTRSMRDDDRARLGANPWLEFLEGKNPGYPETILSARSREHPAKARGHPRRSHAARQAARRQHARSQPGGNRFARAADVGRAGARAARAACSTRASAISIPKRRRAGVPDDVAALVSALDDRRTVVTLVNLNPRDAANGDRAGRRLRRARIRIGRVERPPPAIGAPRRHRAPRARRRRDADVQHAALRQSPDGRRFPGTDRTDPRQPTPTAG